MGVVTDQTPCIDAQVAKLHLAILLDSGATRSLISGQDFQKITRLDPQGKLLPTDVNCVTASGHKLDIVGEAKLTLRIQGFSWKWCFLVAGNLRGRPILGADFMSHTNLILDLGQSCCYFRFAPKRKIGFMKRKKSQSAVNRSPLECRSAEVQCGKVAKCQLEKLQRLIRQYPDVLTPKLGLTNVLEYDIQLLDPTPVRLAPYRLSPPKMQYLREHIKQLLADGVIEPSNSNYSSPMFLVPKSEGNYRAVVDFRVLNKRIAIESVPLPDVHSACHWFGKARYFTTLDLNQAYHQIPLSAASKPLTAFCTDWNLYQYSRVPFGLATGAQVLTRLLDRVFHDLKFDFVYHYLDDVVVYSENFEEHLVHVKTVFDRLRSAGLTVKPEKVVFATQEIAFLGHIISSAGVKIDPERTRSIRDFPPPRDVKGISRFLGMINFYHKFIPNLADVSAPLNSLRRKDVKFSWGEAQQNAFELLKQAIAQPPVLRMADFTKQFIVQTDASGLALGAVLLQEVDGIRQPIAYASRSLSAQERKASSVYELECLAVLFGTEKFRKYIEHQEFILETDNQALSWLLSHPRQLGKIGRWVVKIAALKFQVRHIRGSQNVVADTLSRMFEPDSSEETIQASCNMAVTNFPLAFNDLKELQLQDAELQEIKTRLQSGEKVLNYRLSQGVIYWRAKRGRRQQLVVPRVAQAMIFSYFHESPVGGHLGACKTLNKIRAQFAWKGMNQDIRSRVRECHTCSVSKPAQNTRFGLLSSTVATRPMQKIFIDFVGRFPRSKAGNTFILVCVDAFTKFVWMIALRDATTRSTIRALKERIFSNFSVPEILVSDNARCFVSREFRHFCFEMGVKHITTSPYYPQPSHAERFNKNLRAALIAYHKDAHDTWDQQLVWLQLAFNTAVHESTRSTPFGVMFPFRAGSPLLNLWRVNELLPERWTQAQLQRKWTQVHQNLCRSRDKREGRYNKNRVPSPFKVGDMVYYKYHALSNAGRKIAAKLMPRYRGPFKIAKFLTAVTVRLVDPNTDRFITRAHVSLLKPGNASQD